jgi:hypothetical protein
MSAILAPDIWYNPPMTDRTPLPQRRHSETFELEHGGQRRKYSVTLGYYGGPGSKVGEVFVTGAKAGSEAEANARDAAILLSLALQHGVPLDTIKHAITREADSSPSTVIGRVVDRLA